MGVLQHEQVTAVEISTVDVAHSDDGDEDEKGGKEEQIKERNRPVPWCVKTDEVPPIRRTKGLPRLA